MSEADLVLARIEAILAEIEQADRESGGQFREANDREAGALVSRIIRRRNQQQEAAE